MKKALVVSILVNLLCFACIGYGIYYFQKNNTDLSKKDSALERKNLDLSELKSALETSQSNLSICTEELEGFEKGVFRALTPPEQRQKNGEKREFTAEGFEQVNISTVENIQKTSHDGMNVSLVVARTNAKVASNGSHLFVAFFKGDSTKSEDRLEFNPLLDIKKLLSAESTNDGLLIKVEQDKLSRSGDPESEEAEYLLNLDVKERKLTVKKLGSPEEVAEEDASNQDETAKDEEKKSEAADEAKE